jgi:hypothetical protein
VVKLGKRRVSSAAIWGNKVRKYKRATGQEYLNNIYMTDPA